MINNILVTGFAALANGGVTVHVMGSAADFRFVVPASDIARRQRQADEALASDARDGSGYLHTGDDRDRRVAANEALWQALARTDYDLFVEPILAASGTAPTALVSPGFVQPLPEYSLRRARRQVVLDGNLAIEDLLRSPALTLWHPSAALPLIDLLADRGLPVLEPSRMTLILLPFPDPLLRAALTVARRDPTRVGPLLAGAEGQRARCTAALREALRVQALAAGAEILDEPTRAQFAAALGRGFRPGDERWLVVLGHQDRAGIHCADGPVTQTELASWRRSSDERAYRCADLAVCDAHRPDSLAALVQARGCLPVTCRGRHGYHATAATSWITALQVLRDLGPRPLHELQELVWWIGQTATAPPAPPHGENPLLTT